MQSTTVLKYKWPGCCDRPGRAGPALALWLASIACTAVAADVCPKVGGQGEFAYAYVGEMAVDDGERVVILAHDRQAIAVRPGTRLANELRVDAVGSDGLELTFLATGCKTFVDYASMSAAQVDAESLISQPTIAQIAEPTAGSAFEIERPTAGHAELTAANDAELTPDKLGGEAVGPATILRNMGATLPPADATSPAMTGAGTLPSPAAAQVVPLPGDAATGNVAAPPDTMQASPGATIGGIGTVPTGSNTMPMPGSSSGSMPMPMPSGTAMPMPDPGTAK